MLIQKKFRIGSTLVVLLGVVLIMSAYIISGQMRDNLEAENSAISISNDLGEMLDLSADFLIYPRERILIQWNSRKQDLNTKIEEARRHDYIDQELLEQIHSKVALIDGFMTRLVKLKTTGTIKHDQNLRDRVVDAVASRLREEVRLAVDLAFKLANKHRYTVNRFIDLGSYAHIGIVTIMVILYLVSAWWISKYMLAPITKLREETRYLSEGEFEHRINSNSNDEIGILSNDIDTLAEALQNSMYSRNQLEDIVIERNMEMQVAKDIAEKSSEAKSQFLSRMSHELRTPMNAILGFAYILKKDVHLDENGQMHAQKIMDAGEHLLGLINEVLDISKIDQGLETIECKAVNANDVIYDSLELLSDMADKKGIKLHFTSESSLFVSAEYMRLKQVVINILSNAIKYNKDNGKVTIYFKDRQDGLVDICISDTGSGIAEEAYDKVFQAFERVSPDAYAIDGAGVGLTISKKLIELMGGEISFTSKLGEGSTFCISLKKMDRHTKT